MNTFLFIILIRSGLNFVQIEENIELSLYSFLSFYDFKTSPSFFLLIRRKFESLIHNRLAFCNIERSMKRLVVVIFGTLDGSSRYVGHASPCLLINLTNRYYLMVMQYEATMKNVRFYERQHDIVGLLGIKLYCGIKSVLSKRQLMLLKCDGCDNVWTSTTPFDVIIMVSLITPLNQY